MENHIFTIFLNSNVLWNIKEANKKLIFTTKIKENSKKCRKKCFGQNFFKYFFFSYWRDPLTHKNTDFRIDMKKFISKSVNILLNKVLQGTCLILAYKSKWEWCQKIGSIFTNIKPKNKCHGILESWKYGNYGK